MASSIKVTVYGDTAPLNVSMGQATRTLQKFGGDAVAASDAVVKATVKQREALAALAKQYEAIAVSSTASAEEQATAARLAEAANLKLGSSMATARAEVGKTEASFLSLNKVMGAAIGFSIAGIGLKSLVDSAEHAESANRLLAQTMKDVGLSFSAFNGQIEATISKLSKLGGFTKTDLTTAFTSLVRVTKDAAKAQQDLALAVDVARARHVSLATATNIVVKAQIGMVGMLRRIGIDIAPVTTAVDALKASGDKYSASQLAAAKATDKAATAEKALASLHAVTAGAAEKSTTASEHLSTSLSNLAASLGTALIPELQKAADKLNKWVTEAESSERVHKDLRTAMEGAATAVRALAGAFKLISDAVGGPENAIKTLVGVFLILKAISFANAIVAGFAAITGSATVATAATNTFAGRLAALRAGFAGGLVIPVTVGFLAAQGLTMLQQWLDKHATFGNKAAQQPLTISMKAKIDADAAEIAATGGTVRKYFGVGFQKGQPVNWNLVLAVGNAQAAAAKAGAAAGKAFAAALQKATGGINIQTGLPSAGSIFNNGIPTTIKGNHGGSGGGGGGGNTANLSAGKAKMIALAESMLGTPYAWGGAGPGGFDCSGLVMWAMANGMNVNIPHFTGSQAKLGSQVFGKSPFGTSGSMKNVKPGDVVFTEYVNGVPQHEGLYTGHGNVVEAPHTGDKVKNISLANFVKGQSTYTIRDLTAGSDSGGGGGGKRPPQMTLAAAQLAVDRAKLTKSTADDVSALKTLEGVLGDKLAALKKMKQTTKVVNQEDAIVNQLLGAQSDLASIAAGKGGKGGASALKNSLKADTTALNSLKEQFQKSIKGMVPPALAKGLEAQIGSIGAAIKNATAKTAKAIPGELAKLKDAMSRALDFSKVTAGVAKSAKQVSDLVAQGIFSTADVAKVTANLHKFQAAVRAAINPSGPGGALITQKELDAIKAQGKKYNEEVKNMVALKDVVTTAKTSIATLQDAMISGLLNPAESAKVAKAIAAWSKAFAKAVASGFSDASKVALEKAGAGLTAAVNWEQKLAPQRQALVDALKSMKDSLVGAATSIGAIVTKAITPADMNDAAAKLKAGFAKLAGPPLTPQQLANLQKNLAQWTAVIDQGIQAMIADIDTKKQAVADAWSAFGDLVSTTFDAKVTNKLANSMSALTDSFSAKELTNQIGLDQKALAEAITAGGGPDSPVAKAMASEIALWQQYYADIAAKNFDGATSLQDQIIAGNNALADLLKDPNLPDAAKTQIQGIVDAGNALINDLKTQGDAAAAAAVTTWQNLSESAKTTLMGQIAAEQKLVDAGEALPLALEHIKADLIAAGLSPDDAEKLLADPITSALKTAVEALSTAVADMTALMVGLAAALGITLPDPTGALAASAASNAASIKQSALDIANSLRNISDAKTNEAFGMDPLPPIPVTPAASSAPPSTAGYTGNAHIPGIQMRTGGIVPMLHAMSGTIVPGVPRGIDYVPAMLNGGEMVLNGIQQARLWQTINGGTPQHQSNGQAPIIINFPNYASDNKRELVTMLRQELNRIDRRNR